MPEQPTGEEFPNMDMPLFEAPVVTSAPVQPPPQEIQVPTPHQAERHMLLVMSGMNAVSGQLIFTADMMRRVMGGKTNRDIQLVERALQHVLDAQNDLAGVLFDALKEGNPKK